MDFRDLLNYRKNSSDGPLYWCFEISGLRSYKMVDENDSDLRVFRFYDFDIANHAYAIAQEENVRRLEGRENLLQIGPLEEHENHLPE